MCEERGGGVGWCTVHLFTFLQLPSFAPVAACLCSKSPCCHPLQEKDRKRGSVYEAPTYRVKGRRGNNFITTFQLRTEDDKSKWILRGVALLCSID